MHKKQMISELKTILKKAKINANLKKAIEETIKALNKNDLELAYELSAVKSFVSGDLKSKGHYFREDDDYNNVHLGLSVYSILDGIHHELAFKTGGIPSGMMILTSRGIQKKEKAKKIHPVITMMEKERARIYREV